jgi:hypothetical protein
VIQQNHGTSNNQANPGLTKDSSLSVIIMGRDGTYPVSNYAPKTLIE